MKKLRFRKCIIFALAIIQSVEEIYHSLNYITSDLEILTLKTILRNSMIKSKATADRCHVVHVFKRAQISLHLGKMYNGK